METDLKVESLKELHVKALKMREFQLVHNELRKDFLHIYNSAKQNNENSDSFKPMIRACIKELFMLVESDLFLINQWNPYVNFNEYDRFHYKFKATFKQHAAIFSKENLRVEFNSKNLRQFNELKQLRDSITHPKGRSSIQVTSSDLVRCFQFYELYTRFIQALMTNVFVSTTVPINSLLT